MAAMESGGTRGSIINVQQNREGEISQGSGSVPEDVGMRLTDAVESPNKSTREAADGSSTAAPPHDKGSPQKGSKGGEGVGYRSGSLPQTSSALEGSSSAISSGGLPGSLVLPSSFFPVSTESEGCSTRMRKCPGGMGINRRVVESRKPRVQ